MTLPDYNTVCLLYGASDAKQQTDRIRKHLITVCFLQASGEGTGDTGSQLNPKVAAWSHSLNIIILPRVIACAP